MTYTDLQRKLAMVIKQNHRFQPSEIKDSCMDFESIPTQNIDFNGFVHNYADRWSISEDDFFVFNSILPLNNTSILELGRFFGFSSAAFCCNHAVHLTSLDDNGCDIHSFATLEFFNISEFLHNSEEYVKQNIKMVSLRHKLIDIIAKEFLTPYSIHYIDDAFSPKYLNQRYDFIFEDLVWNKETLHILDDCIAYLNTYPDCVLIVHDDVRFSVVHERIKNLPYCYDSNFFKQKYNITPNLALIATKPISYLS